MVDTLTDSVWCTGHQAIRGARTFPNSLLVGPLGPPWSGAETATAGLAEALALLGPLEVLDSRVSGTNSSRGKPTPAKLARLLFLAAKVNRSRAAIVHLPLSQNVPGLLRDCVLVAAANAPTIGYLHGGEYGVIARRRDRRGQLLRHALSNVSVIACLYREQANELQAVGVATRLATVGNVVSAEWFSADLARSLPGRLLRVLYLGALSKPKGFDVLCEAVRDCNEMQVTAVGEWVAIDRNLGHGSLELAGVVPKNVRVRPPIDRADVPGLLAEHDVLVLPSFSEGLPMVVLEAFAAGLPVIATPVGALRELAAHGMLCSIRPGEVADLRRALLATKSNYRDALSRAAQARSYVRHRYSPAEIASRIQPLMEEVIRDSADSACGSVRL